MTRPLLRLLLPACLLMTCSGPTCDGSRPSQQVRRLYKVVELPGDGRDVESTAFGVNNKGVVAGVCGGKPAVWVGGKLRLLDPTGKIKGQALSINDRGEIVGVLEEDGTNVAFIFKDTSFVRLGTLGGHSSVATDVNQRGTVCGVADMSQEQGPGPIARHAFIWRDGVMKDLGPQGSLQSEAVALNSSGVAIGWSLRSMRQEPYVWTPDSSAMPEKLKGATGGTVLRDINDRGWVVSDVVNEAGGVASGTLFLARNNDRVKMQPPKEYQNIVAYRLNNKNMVVGQMWQTRPSIETAFVARDGKVYDLNPLTVSPKQLRLICATSINDQGQIAGWGNKSRRNRAFLLNPITE